MDFGQLMRMVSKENPQRGKLPNIDMALASIMVNIIKEGDMNALDKLLDRHVGKVTNKTVFEGTINHGSILEYIEGKSSAPIIDAETEE